MGLAWRRTEPTPTTPPESAFDAYLGARLLSASMSDQALDAETASYALMGTLTHAQDARRRALADELTQRRRARRSVAR